MKGIQVLTFMSSLLFICLAFRFSIEVLLFLIPLVALTIFYIVPIIPNKSNLRSVAGVKIFIIGLMWAGTTVMVPVAFAKGSFNLDFWIELVQRFLFIIVMMLPFEIRDLQYDEAALETVPQKIGVTKTKVFGSVLLVVFLLLTATKGGLLPSVEVLSTILVTTISLLFLWGTEKKQTEYYCSFWVESIPIMWLGIVILLQNLFG